MCEQNYTNYSILLQQGYSYNINFINFFASRDTTGHNFSTSQKIQCLLAKSTILHKTKE